MKAFLSLLFIVSIGMNLMFLTGCTSTRFGRWCHKVAYGDPCRLATEPPTSGGDGGKAELASIARSLGIRTEGKTTSDLASDIHYVVDRRPVALAVLSDNTLKEAKKRLPPDSWSEIDKLQNDALYLQGKRTIVYTPEE